MTKYTTEKEIIESLLQTVDPTSARTGGSILGDKTRMVNLIKHVDRTFIRPSPSGGHLGIMMMRI
jgi:putative protein kinase ArgK-like GTPase of G3E family